MATITTIVRAIHMPLRKSHNAPTRFDERFAVTELWQSPSPSRFSVNLINQEQTAFDQQQVEIARDKPQVQLLLTLPGTNDVVTLGVAVRDW